MSVTQNTHALPADKLKALVYNALDDTKAEEVETIDLRDENYITDYMVVATGRSARQVSAMADRIEDAVTKAGHTLVRIEGQQAGDWIVVDLGDIIIHLFRPEVRQFYNIERMWRDRSYGQLATTEAAAASAPMRSHL